MSESRHDSKIDPRHQPAGTHVRASSTRTFGERANFFLALCPSKTLRNALVAGASPKTSPEAFGPGKQPSCMGGTTLLPSEALPSPQDLPTSRRGHHP